MFTIYGIYDWRGRCAYVGVTKDLKRRRAKGWRKGIIPRERIVHALRTVSNRPDALRIEMQVIQAYRRRGEANYNVITGFLSHPTPPQRVVIRPMLPVLKSIVKVVKPPYQEGFCKRCRQEFKHPDLKCCLPCAIKAREKSRKKRNCKGMSNCKTRRLEKLPLPDIPLIQHTNMALPNEVPLKQWVLAQAKHLQVHPRTIYVRFYRGQYPHLKLRKLNGRVVFVQI